MGNGKCSSCHFINCKGVNACRRGSKAAIKSLDAINSNFDFIDAICQPVSTSDSDAAAICHPVPTSDSDTTNGNSDDTSSKKEKDNKAAAKLLRLFDVISTKNKYDACVACVPCLAGGKLEDANFICVNRECPTCGFDKIQSKGLRQ